MNALTLNFALNMYKDYNQTASMPNELRFGLIHGAKRNILFSNMIIRVFCILSISRMRFVPNRPSSRIRLNLAIPLIVMPNSIELFFAFTYLYSIQMYAESDPNPNAIYNPSSVKLFHSQPFFALRGVFFSSFHFFHSFIHSFLTFNY